INQLNASGARDVSIQAGDGNLDLRDATISAEGEIEFLTNQNLFLHRARIGTSRVGDLLFNAGGDVVLENASVNENAGVGTTGFLQINGGGSVS
ncbi:hypothetical protein GN156_26640, partial [bacterium LRH843]|nr:hypothetical protein [bacterium LRH843]